MEGLHCFQPRAGCQQAGLTLPIAEYDHGQGCSVSGGYVYRGSQQPPLAGAYFYGDYCSGRLWAAWRDDDGGWRSQQVADSGLQISTFGEDEAGELFVASLTSGTIYRLVAT